MVKCPECQRNTIVNIGTTCEEWCKNGNGNTVDYFGDGSRYVKVGVHYTGILCSACGWEDAEPCIHD